MKCAQLSAWDFTLFDCLDFYLISIDCLIDWLAGCCIVSDVEDGDTVFASVQLQDESSTEDVSEGVVIEEDSNEVVVYEEEDDDDNFVGGMQFVTEQIVTEQLMSTKSHTVNCQSCISLSSSSNL